MKEQWKKLDSDAKLLVNVEEGKTLPIKIELPISALSSSRDDCCRKLLSGLRKFVLLTFIILLSWTIIVLYTNNFSESTVQSDKKRLVNHQPLSESNGNKLSLQKNICKSMKDDANNIKSNVINVTTESIHDVSRNNVPVKYRNNDTVSNLTSNERNIDGSKSSTEAENSARNKLTEVKLLQNKELKTDDSQNINHGSKIIVNNEKSGVSLIKNNTLMNTNDSNEDKVDSSQTIDNVDNSSENISNTLIKIESADDVVNLLLEGIVNSVLHDQTSDEYVESNETSITGQEINNSEEITKESVNNDNVDSEKVSEIQQTTSLEIDTSDQDNSLYIKQIEHLMFGINSIENEESFSEESIFYSDEEKKNDNEQNESSGKQMGNTSNESTYELELNKIIDELSKISLQERNISDEVWKSIIVDNSSEEERLRKTAFEISRKVFPYIAEQLIPIVGHYSELLTWYYDNMENPYILGESDKLKAYAAELLYSTNIRQYIIDLNRVMDIMSEDSYKSYKMSTDSKDYKMKYYIIDRLRMKLNMYNFFLKYNEYDTIAESRISILNKIENMQSKWSVKELKDNDGQFEKITSEEPITQNTKRLMNMQLLEDIKKVIKVDEDLSSPYRNHNNFEVQEDDLGKSIKSSTTELKEIIKSNTDAEKNVAIVDESEKNTISILATTENINMEKSEELEYELEKQLEWLIKSSQNDDYKNTDTYENIYNIYDYD